MSDILKEPVMKSKNHKSYLNFKFIRFRKTSIAIAVLGLLVFILTMFCMKQQNDYAVLMDECYRQNSIIREIQVEGDSLRSSSKPAIERKRK